MKKALVFPGAFQLVKNYGKFEGLDIWLKSDSEKNIAPADYYIGHSLGGNFLLSICGSQRKGKFILINPLIRKRNILSLIIAWIKFLLFEGIERRKIVPITNLFYAFRKAVRLLNVDVLGIIKNIPKEDLIIIRGKKDNYLCDGKSAEIIKNNKLQLIETDAGHDWNDKIAELVDGIISR